MENTELLEFIEKCRSDLDPDKPILYEAYFLKIFVVFEKFLGDLFEKYCLGESSSQGYIPVRRLAFSDINQLRCVLKSGENRSYIDYIAKIKELSKCFFVHNPFDIILEDAENVTYLNQMIALRNCIAHESDTSITKFKNECLSGREYISPGKFLINTNRRKSKSYYTIYIEKIIEISNGLITPQSE